MKKILKEVEQERIKQDIKWGVQNHKPIEWIAILTEEVGEVAKEACDYHFMNPHNDIDMVTARMKRIDNYRKELIQVAAVAVAMIECLDRNEL